MKLTTKNVTSSEVERSQTRGISTPKDEGRVLIIMEKYELNNLKFYSFSKEDKGGSFIYRYKNYHNEKFNMVFKFDKNNNYLIRDSDTLRLVTSEKTYKNEEISEKPFNYYWLETNRSHSARPILFNEDYGILGIYNSYGAEFIYLKQKTEDFSLVKEIKTLMETFYSEKIIKEDFSIGNIKIRFTDPYSSLDKEKDTIVNIDFFDGYIFHSDLLHPKLDKEIAGNTINFKNDSATLFLSKEKFKKEKFKIGSNEYGATLNDNTLWGVDGGEPREVINKIKVSFGSNKFNLKENDFNYLSEPNFDSMQVYQIDEENIVLEMNNSDGAGGYRSFTFINKNGKVKTIVEAP